MRPKSLLSRLLGWTASKVHGDKAYHWRNRVGNRIRRWERRIP